MKISTDTFVSNAIAAGQLRDGHRKARRVPALSGRIVRQMASGMAAAREDRSQPDARDKVIAER